MSCKEINDLNFFLLGFEYIRLNTALLYFNRENTAGHILNVYRGEYLEFLLFAHV